MKWNIYISVILLLSNMQGVIAQHIDLPHNNFRIGDKNQKECVSISTTDNNGKTLWMVQPISNNEDICQKIFFVPNSNYDVSYSELSELHHFSTDNGSLVLRRAENNQMSIDYDLSEIVIPQSFSYGDCINGLFHGIGTYNIHECALLRQYAYFYRYDNRGLLDDGSYSTIDDLTYTYKGNQVVKINDSAEESPCYDGAMHFVDNADQEEEYTYDANGNMTSDLNKRILHIDYNELNLPRRINVEALRVGSGASRTIKYTYATDGTKLRAEYNGMPFTPIILPSTGGSAISDYPFIGGSSIVDGGTYIVADSFINVKPSTTYSRTSTIDYCANLIYENKKLSTILFDGGYASVDADGNIAMHYYVKDHLGSNRLVVDGNGNIEETNHYYPFGALMGDSKNVKRNKYKYVGKELDRMYGIDMQDHGARWYDPVVGRWTVTDPLSVKYNNNSMYVSCLNNPLVYLDTNGESVTLYATLLPGNDYLTAPTHTFLVVRNKNGEVVKYYAYGSKHDGIRGLIGDKLTRVKYDDDKAIINGKKKERLKAEIEIMPPKGMTSEEFDKKIIQTAESFGNNDNIAYDLFPITDVTGNCNSSTSTILIKAGVDKKEMKRIKTKIPGIDIGFSIDKAKPWTKYEQKKALENLLNIKIPFDFSIF